MRSLRSIFIIAFLLVPTLLNAQLRKGEASVDFFLENGSYYAELNRAEWNETKIVWLCGENDLKDMPLSHKLYSEKNAQAAYERIFRSLEQYLKKGDRIYFCPREKLCLVNFAGLMDFDGIRLCEKYHFFRLSDIRALPEDQPNHRYYNALLFGGMNYYADTDRMNEHCILQHVKGAHELFCDIKGEDPAKLDLGTADDGTRAGCNNLKSSKKEIKFIFKLQKNFFASPHTESSALEEVFKNSTRRTNEYMVHLSTHGFSSKVDIKPEDNEYDIRDKVWKSCGLLFSGAGHTLDGKTMPNAYEPNLKRTLGQMNDGLLYGVEIAKLDMSNCSLLVLAACNTAVGVVTQDGIVGLQSAFKDAGVHTLLMTLWSVNDEATTEFMKLFYTYLSLGKTKHESLELARADFIRSADYSDPIYWAPFIMLD